MLRRIYTGFVLSVLMLVSCKSEQEKMNAYVQGKWKMVFAKITMPTYQGSDQKKINSADFLNPKDKNAITENFYVFKENHTFELWSTMNGKILGEKDTGKWAVTKDKMIWHMNTEKGTFTVRFDLKKIEDGFSLQTLQDRDKDGAVDDIYYIEVKKKFF